MGGYIATKAILFSFGCSEVNSTWLITSELANQRARKVLFTCVVYTNSRYFHIIDKPNPALSGFEMYLLSATSFQTVSGYHGVVFHFSFRFRGLYFHPGLIHTEENSTSNLLISTTFF